MKDYAIMREAGPRAKASAQRNTYAGYSRPRRMAVVSAESPGGALEHFIAMKYRPGHRQFESVVYGGSRREPTATVLLRNGEKARHTVTYYAWAQ